MFSFGNFRALATAAVLVVSAGMAQAATLCSALSPNVSSLVTPNSGCLALISPDNDDDTAVNGLFLVTGWSRIDKVDPLPGIDGALTLTGTKQVGSWSISASVFSAWQNVMLVFKGADGALPDAVIAYRITGSSVSGASGTYATPFFDVQGGSGPNAGQFKPKDISHVSLYVATPALVPVPAAGFLLIGALGGLAVLRRRRKAI